MSKEMIKSAGVVVVRNANGKHMFLMLRAYNYWDFPKGKVEPGEDLMCAATRETLEEASISSAELDFKWGNETYTTEPYKKGTKTATYFVAETFKKNIELPINHELGKPEHHEYRWVTYEEAKSLADERISKVIDWANKKIT